MRPGNLDLRTDPLPAGVIVCLSAAALTERMEEEINRAGRHGTPLSCLLVVIENLDELTRAHGSELSEQTLVYVSEALRHELRRFDRVGRPSEGELAVLLPGADGPRGEIVARRALKRLRAIKIEAGGQRRPLRVSVGLAAAWLHELGLEARAALVEPLSMEGYGGGLVIALRRDGGFRGPDREALNAFATSVAQRMVAERSVEIERLRYGMEARERERTRWAREIHDEAIQGLGALRLKLAHARDLDEQAALSSAVESVLEGLGEEIDGLRHLITELRPAALDDLGLAAALQALARRMQAIDGLDVQTAIDLGPEYEDRRLDAELESTIYRVVQEGLPNVSRHAQATQALVSVSAREGVIRASVTDDGVGLPEADRLGPRGDGLEGGFGMSGMRERAELVGGELELVPAPGRGTVMRLSVPLAGRPVEPSLGDRPPSEVA